MADKKTLDPNKTLDQHLNSEELFAAVWDHPNAPIIERISYIRMYAHLERCTGCTSLVEKEQATNPTYKRFLELVPEKMNYEEFWKEIVKAKPKQ